MKFNPNAKLDRSQVKYKLPSGKEVTYNDFMAFLALQSKLSTRKRDPKGKEAV